MVLVIFSLFFIFLSLMPLVKSSHWVFRCMDFPVQQLLVVGILLIVLNVVYFSHAIMQIIVIIGLLIIVCFEISKLFPFTFFYRKDVPDVRHIEESRSISVLIANVLMTNKNIMALQTFINNESPDVVLTLETNQFWQDGLETIENCYPYRVAIPKENLYGMHMYSKLPLSHETIRYLIEDEVPSIRVDITLRNNETIQFYALHPAPPSPTENEKSIERDAELVTVAKEIAGGTMPTIVTGDLNDVAWSSSTLLFKKISGLVDPRVGRGLFSTFHAKYWMLRWPLDHVFHSTSFELASIKRLGYFGSDHFPVFFKLQLSDTSQHLDYQHQALTVEEIDNAEDILEEVQDRPSK